LRSVVRIPVLAASDLATVLVLGGAITLVRDRAVLGSTVAQLVQQVLPLGYLGGWRFGIALLVGLWAARNYGQGDARRDPVRLFSGVTLATALSVWHSLWVVGIPRVALELAVTTGVFWLALWGMRRGVDWLVNWARARSGHAEAALFIGDPADPRAREIQERLLAGGMVSLGWIVPNGKSGLQPLDSPEDIWRILAERRADTVVLAARLREDLFRAVVEASTAAGCRTLLVPGFDGVTRLRPSMVWYHGVPFTELSLSGLAVPHLLLKRWIDVVGSLVALIVLSPLLLCIAIAIRLDSPGPVLFRQERVGLGGRVFRVLKFRTMRLGADEEKAGLAHLNHTRDPRLFKIPNDPRVTRVGAWLRRWSLDELPQLWNVLVGDMSLVGPRPFPVSDLAGYQDHHFLRLSAKPGITGLWQVKGRSEIVDFEEVVRLDREYIERWSVWLDLGIMLQTLPAVLRRRGAY